MTGSSTKTDTYAVLIVEDDAAQRTTLADMLAAEEFDADAYADAHSALAVLASRDYVAAVIDQRLPDMPGTDLLQRIREQSPETRVIIHTGYGSFESARDAVNRGAFAYVEKLADPASLITYVHRAVQARIAAQLRESEERFREVTRSLHEVVWAIDARTRRTVYVNEAVEELTGRSINDFMQDEHAWASCLHPDDRDAVAAAFASLDTDAHTELEVRFAHLDGTERWVHLRASAVANPEGEIIRYAGTIADISRRKATEAALRESEAQLRHAQKMEAIGRLAGGIAHDFNNLLTAVNGYLDLARRSLEANHPALRSLDALGDAARQAAGIASALLTFTHRAPTTRADVRLSEVVDRAATLLRRSLPGNIRVVLRTPQDHDFIRADDAQIQQVIMNLAINARDAMPKGGTLILRTESQGDEVRLIVTDTGEGMTEDVRSRIFEPYFTTRDPESGSGLGMSIILGIVEDHDGTIDVTSAPGRGTTVTIRFPRLQADASVEIDARRTHSSEDVALVVEDNEIVRGIVTEMLVCAGYHVRFVPNASEASRLSSVIDRLDLLVLDYELPDRTGIDLLRDLRAAGVDAPAVVITGTTDCDREEASALGAALLRKPFKMIDLEQTVEDLRGDL